MGLRWDSYAFFPTHVERYPKGTPIPNDVAERAYLIAACVKGQWESIKDRYGAVGHLFANEAALHAYARRHGLGVGGSEDQEFIDICLNAKRITDTRKYRRLKMEQATLRRVIVEVRRPTRVDKVEGYAITSPDGKEIRPYMTKREAKTYCYDQGWSWKIGE